MMPPDEYAVAQLHYFELSGSPHPWPARECPDCGEIARRRRELARQCPV